MKVGAVLHQGVRVLETAEARVFRRRQRCVGAAEIVHLPRSQVHGALDRLAGLLVQRSLHAFERGRHRVLGEVEGFLVQVGEIDQALDRR